VAEDLAETIADDAANPRQVTVDGVTVQQHSLPDQIAADKYLQSRTAARTDPRKAFTRVKIVAPGAS